MTLTTKKASKTSNNKGRSNVHNPNKKRKRDVEELNRSNPKGKKDKNNKKTTNSRQNSHQKKRTKASSKGKAKPKQQVDPKEEGGASGARSSKAASKSKDRRVTFQKSNGPSTNSNSSKKTVSILKNKSNGKPKGKPKEDSKDTSLGKNFKEQIKKLDPVLAPLPKFMQDSTREFALLMLTQRVSISHKLSIIKKFDTKPDYIPLSARFKFTLTCCDDLKHDASQQSDADEISQKILELQSLIRAKTRNTVERETNILKGKMIKDLFNFLFKTTKAGFILFKANNKKLKFSKSDNAIVKHGIVLYFQEQTHDYYCEYFLLNRENFLEHLRNLKDDLFNDPTDQTESVTTSNSNPDRIENEQPKEKVPTSSSSSMPEILDTPPAHDSKLPSKKLTPREQLDLAYSNTIKDQNFRHTPSHQDMKYDKKVFDTTKVAACNDDDSLADENLENDSDGNEVDPNSKMMEEVTTDMNDNSSIESGSLISESSLVKISKQLKEQKSNPPQVEIISNQVHSTVKDQHHDSSDNMTSSMDLFYSEGFDNLQGVYYVKHQLKNILPHLTYKLLHSYNKKMDLKRGEKLAETFYSNFEYNQATEATAAALELEEKANPETLGEMVTEIAEDVFNKKVKLTVIPSLAKNFQGGQKSMSQPCQIGATQDQIRTPRVANSHKRKRSTATNSGNTRLKIRKLGNQEKRELKENVRDFQDELKQEEKPSEPN